MVLLLLHLAPTVSKELQTQDRFPTVPGLKFPAVQIEQCCLMFLTREDGTDSCYGGRQGMAGRKHVLGVAGAQAICTGGWAHLCKQWPLSVVDGEVCKFRLKLLLASVSTKV